MYSMTLVLFVNETFSMLRASLPVQSVVQGGGWAGGISCETITCGLPRVRVLVAGVWTQVYSKESTPGGESATSCTPMTWPVDGIRLVSGQVCPGKSK